MPFVPYRNGIVATNDTLTGDASLAINNNFKAIADGFLPITGGTLTSDLTVGTVNNGTSNLTIQSVSGSGSANLYFKAGEASATIGYYAGYSDLFIVSDGPIYANDNTLADVNNNAAIDGSLNVNGSFSTDSGYIYSDGIGDLTILGAFTSDCSGGNPSHTQFYSDGDGNVTAATVSAAFFRGNGSNITSISAANITTGTLTGTYGGTGVNNGTKTITLGGNLITSGANQITLTTSGTTALTLPTSGTLLTTTGSGASLTGISAGQISGLPISAVNSVTTGTGLLLTSGTLSLSTNITATKLISVSQALTSGSTIAWNTNSGQVATLTLATNATLSLPTNLTVGTYVLTITQDTTGSRTLAYASGYKWPGGVAPALSTAANSVDILTFVSNGSNLYGVLQRAFA